MKWATVLTFFVGALDAESDEGDVVILKDSTFSDMVMKDETSIWFIEFYAPWCGHCKTLEPIWNQLAQEVKGKVRIGKLDATEETAMAKRFGIQGFPTLKLFPAGKKSDDLVVSYDDARDLSAMKNFALAYYALTAEAEQLTGGREHLEKLCQNSLCVIAFLPHILDSNKEGRKKYLNDFNEAARSSGGLPCTFLWSQGGDLFEFEEKLNLAFGFPATIALHLGKGKYGVHRGSFDQTGLRGFLTALMGGGSVPLFDLPKELPLPKATPWDGEDGKLEVLDEL